MRRMLCAGAFALAMVGFVPGLAYAVDNSDITAAQPRINIARIKNVLRLKPEQLAYWPPVEAALRSLSHSQSRSEGLVHRVASYVMDGAALARIGAAARPLVRVLDDRQKQDAIALCYEMGLGQVLAALN